MNKDKMVKVRLLSDGGFENIKHINFPLEVMASKDPENETRIYVDSDQLRLQMDHGMFWFIQSEYELITEEEPEQQQQTIEQLLVTRNEYKEDIKKTEKMIIDVDTEIIERLGPLGYQLIVAPNF
jgi:hypothetical protein